MTEATQSVSAATRTPLGGDDEELKLDRTIITPEGIPLTVRLASRADRIGAAFVDLFIVVIFAALIALVSLLTMPGVKDRSLLGSSALLAGFLFRLTYYPATELAWRGRTPGKRLMGLRVIDRSGGGLRADAVMVRTLLREVELWLPMSMILSLNMFSAEGSWETLLTCTWLAVLDAIPLFNRDIMRAGDMLAGTWVVRDNRVVLLPDLGAGNETVGSASSQTDTEKPSASAAAYAFTRQQLDAYGIHELETLANVLRDRTTDAARLQAAVAIRIHQKIDYKSGAGETTEGFLRAYYKALRRHLEHKLLFGKRRLSKYDPA